MPSLMGRHHIVGLAIALVSLVMLFVLPAASAHAAPTTSTISTSPSPREIVVAGSKLYVLNSGNITVINTVDNSTSTITISSLLGRPDRGVYVPSDGSLWITSYANPGGEVIRIDTATDTVTNRFSGATVSGPSGIVASSSKVYVAMNGSDKIAVFDLGTKTQDADLSYNAASPNNSPFTLALAAGVLYIFQGNSDSVVPWTLSPPSQGATINTGLGAGASLATLAPGGGSIYFGNGSSVSRLDVPGNTVSSVVTGLTSARGLAVSADGTRLYIARSGGVTVLSLPGYSVAGQLSITGGSNGVALPAAGSTLYVSLASAANLTAVGLNPTLSTTNATVDVNVPVSLSAPVATGFWTDPVYSSTSLPPGLSLNTANGVISGTPTVPQAATNVILTATTDTFTRTSTFTITVVDPNAPPPSSGGSERPEEQAVPELARTGFVGHNVGTASLLFAVVGAILMVIAGRLSGARLFGSQR